NVRDELLRVDGVSDINFLGERDYSIRAWLDPQKLAALNMTALDVANAVRSQNVEAAAGQVGRPPAGRGQRFQVPSHTLGRLSTPEQFADIIVKVGQGYAPPTYPGPATPLQANGQVMGEYGTGMPTTTPTGPTNCTSSGSGVSGGTTGSSTDSTASP